MNKVEQVAIAIEELVAAWAREDAETVDIARAAIEAMRGPTQYQLATGWAQLKRNGLPKLGPGPGLIEAYNAMIDAALTQPEGE